MIILLVDGQVRTIRNTVPCGCRSRYRTGRAIAGSLVLITELMCVTHMTVVMFLAIRALVIFASFGFPRASSVWFR